MCDPSLPRGPQHCQACLHFPQGFFPQDLYKRREDVDYAQDYAKAIGFFQSRDLALGKEHWPVHKLIKFE
jgi:hypothetical protein